jgi:pilus assembly protein TadC
MTHNRLHEAEEIVRRIEANIERQKNITLEMPLQMLTLKIGGLSFPQIVSEILNNYLSRAFLSLALVPPLVVTSSKSFPCMCVTNRCGSPFLSFLR